MNTPYFLPIPVQEESQPGSARREAARVAALQGMSQGDVGRVSIVVTEAANNVVKHGHGGEILIRGCHDDGASCVDILALDKGKGMSDLEACMRDGYSTSGTPGTGLGAMRRLSDALEVYSQPEAGTAIYSRIDSGKPEHLHRQSRVECGALSVPVAGETRCGDSWAVHHTETHSVFLVVDGLGHGAGAAEAADEAVAAFERLGDTLNPLDILDETHHVLRKTRGAAVSIASIDYIARKLRFAGVGNVGGAIIFGGKHHNLVTHNGIIGHSVARMQDFTYDFPEGATLAMISDGISSHWSLTKYPGIQSRSALLAAALIYRDCSRRRDDATVLIARERAKGN
ncbi:MAG TPA: ATP-binding SpoIIE family protein phosphatase [Candidatus Koribacter sp.]